MQGNLATEKGILLEPEERKRNNKKGLGRG